MGLFKSLKKLSPVSVDKKIAGIGNRIANRFGDKLGASLTGTVAKTDDSKWIARNKAAEHKVGGTFRDIDRAGGKFTPLQIDNAVARRGQQWTNGRDVGSGLVVMTTTQGPKDGSDDRYYDSDRNASLALAGVVGGFAAAGASGGASGAEALNAFDSGAMAEAVGYTSPGWAGGTGSALLAENSFDSGAMWAATGSETPWYAGLGSQVGKFLASDLGKRLAGQPDAAQPAASGGGAYEPLGAGDAIEQDNLTGWAVLALLGAGFIAYKKGWLHG